MAYGYFNATCNESNAVNSGLTSSDNNRVKSPLADKVLGATTKGGQTVSELPKAGPAETFSLIGAVLLGLGLIYNLRINKTGSRI